MSESKEYEPEVGTLSLPGLKRIKGGIHKWRKWLTSQLPSHTEDQNTFWKNSIFDVKTYKTWYTKFVELVLNRRDDWQRILENDRRRTELNLIDIGSDERDDAVVTKIKRYWGYTGRWGPDKTDFIVRVADDRFTGVDAGDRISTYVISQQSYSKYSRILSINPNVTNADADERMKTYWPKYQEKDELRRKVAKSMEKKENAWEHNATLSKLLSR